MALYSIDRSTAALQILVYLHMKGPSSKWEIVHSLKSGRVAVEHSVDMLRRLGLIECVESKAFPFPKIVALTKEGRVLVNSPVTSWPKLLLESAGR